VTSDLAIVVGLPNQMASRFTSSFIRAGVENFDASRLYSHPNLQRRFSSNELSQLKTQKEEHDE